MHRSLPTLALFALLLTVAAAGAQSLDNCRDGLSLFASGDRAAAEPLLAECAATGVAEPQVLVALAVITYEDGRTWDALDWSRRAVENAPDSAEARFWLGRALLATGDAEAARAQWDEGLGRDAEHPGLLRALAGLHLEQGHEQPAYGLLTQLVRVGGADRWAFRTLSDLAGRRGLWGQALYHWRTLMETTTPAPADYRHAGELAIMAGDTTYAVTASREAVLQEPSPASYATLGEACFAARRFDQAETALRNALHGDPQLHAARFHLANTLELQGRVEEAGAEFSAYVRAMPQDPHGFHVFSVHLDKQGLLEPALSAARRAVEIAPLNVQYGIHLAELLERRPDLDLALKVVEALLADGGQPRDQLLRWRDHLAAVLAESELPENAGKFKLLHIALPDTTSLAALESDLGAGYDFSALATRYSVARNAATGGELGWMEPGDLAGELQSAVAGLREREISPPVASGGLIHIFKRIQ